jgi:elongator complex protein 5
MPPTPLQQRRAHNTLLFQKLLNLREGASPFTLVLDTLEQSGAPLIAEFVRRAKVCLFIYIFFRYSSSLPPSQISLCNIKDRSMGEKKGGEAFFS